MPTSEPRPPVRRGRLPLALLAGLLALPGCGGAEESDDASMGVEPGAAMDTTPAGTPAPPPREVIEQEATDP